MFWSFILPVQLTAGLISLLIACVTLAAPLLRWHRTTTLCATFLLGLVAFIPSCIGIMSVLDAKRFGIFKYEAFADVNDFRVERYLPPTASNITIEKSAQGFRAKFSMTKVELDTYMAEHRDQVGESLAVEPNEKWQITPVDAASHALQFGDLGWRFLPDTVEYCPPADSGGFSVRFSESAGTAYLLVGYW